MAPDGKIRLSEFVSIFGMERGRFLGMAQRGEYPFRVADESEGQRTYDGAEALAMELFLTLIRDGSRLKPAADSVIRSGVVATALDQIEAGRDCDDLCFVVPDSDLKDEWTETLWPCVIRTADIGAFVAGQIGAQDAPTVTTFEGREFPLVGLRSLRLVPLGPAYRSLQAKAKKIKPTGFTIQGRRIIRQTEEAGE